MSGEKEHIRTTCPRDCYDACGIVVVRREGRIVKVLGDPEHPVSRGALCGKCAIAYNGVWRDPEARLTTPLRRRGAKGAGRFEPIGWDEALDEIATRFKAIADDPGPQAILHAHYTGTCSLIAGKFPMRFFNRLGATEVDPDTVCNNAGHVALGYAIGASALGFDPRTARDAACIVVWGANPSASAPHAHKHWLRDAPAKVVVVDPIRHDTAAAADLHLQLRPGTDAALAFALVHVLARDGALDRDFIAAHVAGWDEIEATVADCTPAWGEARTGVPAADIERAAALYAAGPALLWLGQGLQRQPMGGNAMRACALLPAVTGNFGRPGTGLYYLNGGARRGIDGDYLAGSALARGTPPPPVSHMALAARLEDAAASRAFVCWNMNVAASGPDQARLRRALAREDLFTVVVELFQTDTADLADIVLPAASFLEFDDLVSSYFHLTIAAQVGAEPPPGAALPNQEIFRRLARAMGFDDPALFEPDEAIIARVLEDVGFSGGFAELARRGTAPIAPEPVIQFPDLRFPTPSGRIEIASPAAEAAGHPRLPLPHADAPPGGDRLRLLSPASRWLLNGSYANDPKIAAKLGPACVALNPEDARARGLAAGMRARLVNETGSLELAVEIDETLPRGVALAHKGRWARLEPGGANVNALYDGAPADMGESTAVHGVEVAVAPA